MFRNYVMVTNKNGVKKVESTDSWERVAAKCLEASGIESIYYVSYYIWEEQRKTLREILTNEKGDSPESFLQKHVRIVDPGVHLIISDEISLFYCDDNYVVGLKASGSYLIGKFPNEAIVETEKGGYEFQKINTIIDGYQLYSYQDGCLDSEDVLLAFLVGFFPNIRNQHDNNTPSRKHDLPF